MTHIPDLSRCDELGDVTAVAIGWLSADAPFEQGSVTRDDFSTLIHLLVAPWQPFASAGYHRCELCRFTGGPAEVQFEGMNVRVGNANLIVPAADALYVAPSSIAHCVDANMYRPPDVFLRAARECPPMVSVR